MATAYPDMLDPTEPKGIVCAAIETGGCHAGGPPPAPESKIEVRIPEDCVGKVVGDLSSRRGRILDTGTEGRFQIVRADVPAMELYRYGSILRSLTGGRGVHSEQFSRYQEMPREIEQRVIDEAKKAKAGNSSATR